MMRQIDYVCFANRSGYAQAAQDYIDALHTLNKYDIRINLLHSNPDQLAVTPKRYSEMLAMMKKQARSDVTHVYHCIPDMQRRVSKVGKTVGFGTFETFDPPEQWVNILNGNDAVICPSLFNCQVFQKAGVSKPIHYVPHCIDVSLFSPSVPSPAKERFTFLFFGTWKRRKGWPELIEAFFTEFDANDGVELLIKTDRLTLSQKNIGELKEQLGFGKKETAPIKWETKVLTERELPALFKRADCLISPSLGEGFGLPGLQAMAMGIPVAITNFSGPTEYATEETATLIEPTKFIVCNEMDTIPQFRNKKWANVTAESVAKTMRYVVENYDAARAKAEKAVDIVRQNYSYTAVAKKFDSLLETL